MNAGDEQSLPVPASEVSNPGDTSSIPKWVSFGLLIIASVVTVRDVWRWLNRAPGEVLHEPMSSVLGSMAFLLLVVAIFFISSKIFTRTLLIGSMALLALALSLEFL
jgi:cytochrome b561